MGVLSADELAAFERDGFVTVGEAHNTHTGGGGGRAIFPR